MLTTDVVNLPNSELESHRVHNLIRNARRRVVGQRFLNQSLSAIAIALCIAVVAYLSLPLYQSVMPAVQTLLLICAGIFSVCLAVAWVSSLTKRPSFDAIAIEVDRRFQFAERLTTVTQLTPNERHSAAARALLQDTQAKLSTIKLADQFPVQPTRWAWGVPIFGAAMALAIVFYEPDFSKASENSSSTEVTLNDTKKPETPKPASSIAKPDQQQLPKNSMERKKSVELENLQNELNETMKKWQQTPATTDEQQREKVTELTAMQEKLKKFAEKEYQKLKQLDEQLQQLDRTKDDKDFADGPAKKLVEALAKRDLKSANEAVDELKKKAKEKNLSSEDLKKLDRQMNEVKQELARQEKQKAKEDTLKKQIDNAKKNGEDAESLQRELSDLQDEMKSNSEAGQRMAKRMQKLSEAAEKGDLDEVAEQLNQLGGDLQNLQDKLEDLETADDYLQKLKDDLKQACKQCKGGKNSDNLSDKDDADWKETTNPATGKRKENRDAQTNSKDEKLKGLFDPRGKKSYAGAVKGPSFTKKSTVELGQDIQQAAQEAPQGIDTQRLPRASQEAVKEYYETLGGNPNK